MDKLNGNFQSIEQVTSQYLNKNSQTSEGPQLTSEGLSFRDILQQNIQDVSDTSELKFSKHASQRIESRNIDLSEEQMDRLETGAQMAGEKGIKESLIMVDNYAFIVNIPNNTVITAVDSADNNDSNIFTNIDGAVIN